MISLRFGGRLSPLATTRCLPEAERSLINQAASEFWETMSYTIGVDYGSNSVRAIVVDVSDGNEIGSCVVNYPSGSPRHSSRRPRPQPRRQHPGDYLFGLEKSVRTALDQAAGTSGFSPSKVIGVGVDTTGSSPFPSTRRTCPCDQCQLEGQPRRPVLALEGSHRLA